MELINFYHLLPTNPTARDYILEGRNYRFLTGLHPEFENLTSLVFKQKHQLSFDESAVQEVKEES